MYTISRDTPLNLETLNKYLTAHLSGKRRAKQQELHRAYLGDYPILYRTKPDYKPNNTLVNNYAKYIVDTFCGFFDGKPLTVSSQNETVNDVVKNFDTENMSDHKNYELIKQAAIFGNCYELMYQDEDGHTRNAVLNPLDTFVVYDDTVEHRPVFGVTFRRDAETMSMTGEMYTNDRVYSFEGMANAATGMWEIGTNEYYTVPLIEYTFNNERQGIFENVLSLINAYNQVLSEKANDVEYFSDAYMVILGADLGIVPDKEPQEQLEELTKNIKQNRLLWLNSDDTTDGGQLPDVKFLGKPEADTTQENLLKHLEENIFHLSMVANISDESFGTASGIALQYKLLNMRNLAKTVERSVTMSMRQRYKMLFSFASNISPALANEWATLEFKFYENLPVNALETAQALATFKGLVSDETALKMAGIDNPQEELERMEKEDAPAVFDFEKGDVVNG